MHRELRDRGFTFEYRDMTQVKGIGKVRTYFLTGCTEEAKRSVGIDRAIAKLGALSGADGNLLLGEKNGGHHSLSKLVSHMVQSGHRKKRYETVATPTTAV